MPVNYSTSKVYKIISNCGDMIYVGSTTKPYLSARLAQHKTCYKAYKNGTQRYISSYNLFDTYGADNCEIVLLETCPCNNKDELKLKERFYIESLSCVNKNIPSRTREESVKAYYESNKDVINEKANTKFTCECGGKYTRVNKNQHLKSKKHINAVVSASNLPQQDSIEPQLPI